MSEEVKRMSLGMVPDQSVWAQHSLHENMLLDSSFQ